MEHRFTVPVGIDAAWSALLDPEKVAPCMPGASLTKAEGDEFAGSVKVKLGPVSLTYKGTGTFAETDAQARRVVIDASGKDTRGNGTAAATVTASLSEEGDGTAVDVDTDLKITGKPAQMGRGMISDVAAKILDQFAACLAERLGGSPAEPSQTGDGSARSSGPHAGKDPTSATAAATTGATVSNPADSEHPGGSRSELSVPDNIGRFGDDGLAAASGSTAASATSPGDAMDLVDVAGAPILKRMLPLVGAIAVLVVAGLLVRRRKRRG